MNANPFAAFQNAQPAAPVAAPQNVAQPGNPFGAAPVQQPPQAQPQVNAFGPAAGAPQPQQPVAGFGAGYALPDLSDVGESGREPGIPEGLSVLLFKANTLKTRQGHTAIALFNIVSHQAPADKPGEQKQPGTVVSFVKKIPAEVDKRKTAIGYALPMVRALAGFTDEATFKQQVPYWAQLLAAFINGDPKFAEWAAGKKVGTRGTQGEEIIPKSGPDAGKRTGRFYVQLEWFPVAQ